jgi:hypothetical protein
VPVAIKDDVDVAGRSPAFGTDATARGRRPTPRSSAALRDAGRSSSQDERPRAHDRPLHGVPDWGKTRNPWDLQRTARRLERRQRRGGSRPAWSARAWAPTAAGSIRDPRRELAASSGLKAPARSASPAGALSRRPGTA